MGNKLRKESSIQLLPPETLTHILSYLYRKDRITASSVSRLFNDIIRHNVGFDYLYIKESSDCLVLKGSPLLKNTKMRCRKKRFLTRIKLSSYDLGCLYGVHTIDLSHAKINDEGILALVKGGKHNIHMINLQNTPITDVSLKALSGVHTINICMCDKITVEGIKALKDVHTISLHHAKDVWLKQLGNVSSIRIGNGSLITDDGISSLTNLKHLFIFKSDKITDEGVMSLVKLEHLEIYKCRLISNSCLDHLT